MEFNISELAMEKLKEKFSGKKIRILAKNKT
jgi:hypothetical protein